MFSRYIGAEQRIRVAATDNDAVARPTTDYVFDSARYSQPSPSGDAMLGGVSGVVTGAEQGHRNSLAPCARDICIKVGPGRIYPP